MAMEGQVFALLSCLAALLSLRPSFVTCVKWPDNSTQYKGYIEVSCVTKSGYTHFHSSSSTQKLLAS